ncbi:unnamed protein product [Adineta ricciae]|uniref:Transmembrane protein 144 n=1 Tax=Adineta ricciae TaxID=249248 RepID=A0A815HAG6_ADIRI|nr:unnamed protein product [Adineta ricciae]
MTTLTFDNTTDLPLSVFTLNLTFNTIEALTNGNTTTVAAITDAAGSIPIWIGFIGCLVASIFFGSNFVPVKQFSAGDGFFFQFVFCVAVYMVGLIVDLIIKNEHWYPLVLIGGALWTTGNLVTVFCIKTCGLTVGLLIWGTTSLIVGWAGGRFGLMDIKPQVPPTTPKLIMNYASVVLAAISAIFFVFIKSTNAPRNAPRIEMTNGSRVSVDIVKEDNMPVTTEEILDTDFPFLNKISDPIQKVIGCSLAALSGVFYGIMFIPDQYIRDHPDKFIYKNERPPNNGLYYISSQYAGIFFSSTIYFVIYAVLKRNRPSINASIVLPAMVSGLLWAIANIGFIVAISSLKSAVAYPIVSVLPGIVTSLWSLFWFREIQGKRNFIFLGIGMIVRCVAALLSGLSA